MTVICLVIILLSYGVAECGHLEVRPLYDEEIQRLTTNLPMMLDKVNVDLIVHHLYANRCITRFQKEHLTEKKFSSIEKVTELVEILIRRSFADFKLFLDVLDGNAHRHVAIVLREGGGSLYWRLALCSSLVE